MQRISKPQSKVDWDDFPVLSVESSGYQLMEEHVEENWLHIATFASQYHDGYGRGAVQLSEEGQPEDYVTEDELEKRRCSAKGVGGVRSPTRASLSCTKSLKKASSLKYSLKNLLLPMQNR